MPKAQIKSKCRKPRQNMYNMCTRCKDRLEMHVGSARQDFAHQKGVRKLCKVFEAQFPHLDVNNDQYY